jgi:hypothetical protein
MLEKKGSMQVKPQPGSTNGVGDDHLAVAETAAPERDLPSEETVGQALSDDPLDLSSTFALFHCQEWSWR